MIESTVFGAVFVFGHRQIIRKTRNSIQIFFSGASTRSKADYCMYMVVRHNTSIRVCSFDSNTWCRNSDGGYKKMAITFVTWSIKILILSNPL